VTLCRIIEPITSRCSKFRFKPLDSTNAVARLRTICDGESVNCQDPALEKLIRISEGDLRRAIQTLQSASRLHAGEEITVSSIEEIGGVIPEHLMHELGMVLGLDAYAVSDDADVKMKDRIKGRSEFETVQGMVVKVVREGYSAPQILSQVSSGRWP
jgi:replication factor C subunit 2/4